jgi:hypothetical protein
MSGRQAARRLHEAIARYSGCAWQRERVETVCPLRHRGRINEFAWQILRCRDYPPGIETIRKTLERAT